MDNLEIAKNLIEIEYHNIREARKTDDFESFQYIMGFSGKKEGRKLSNIIAYLLGAKSGWIVWNVIDDCLHDGIDDLDAIMEMIFKRKDIIGPDCKEWEEIEEC